MKMPSEISHITKLIRIILQYTSVTTCIIVPWENNTTNEIKIRKYRIGETKQTQGTPSIILSFHHVFRLRVHIQHLLRLDHG